MTTPSLFLPGSVLPMPSIPVQSKSKSLTLGPGLRHIPPSTILATSTGIFIVDQRKAAFWLDQGPSISPRYRPSVGDLVIAQIHHSGAGDIFYCALSSNTNHVILGQLSFEGANRKTRPKLESGDLVYARVKTCGRDEECEIECVNSNTGKSEGMGPLRGGMVFDVSNGFARRLMMGKREKSALCVLDAVGEKRRFEVAIGRNGRIWIDSQSARETALIGRLLKDCDDQGWGLERQKMEVARRLGS